MLNRIPASSDSTPGNFTSTPTTTAEKLRALLASPAACEQLKDCEELSLWGLHTGAPADFPEVITRLVTLKRLNLGNNSWKNIPESITALQNLEELQLDCALSHVKTLPDFSKLKKLKIVRASGAAWLDTRPPADPALLKYFFNITSLELLRINSWGRVTRRTRELRPALTPAHLEGLGRLRNLKQLILDNNQLQSLPAEIAMLALDYLGLRKNHLAPAAINAIAAANPATLCDTRDNTPPPGSEPPAQIETLLRRASGLANDCMSHRSLAEAIRLNTQVIEHYAAPGVEEDSHNLCYALYGFVYSCGRLLYNCSDSMTAGEIESIKSENYKTAAHLVRHLQQNWSPMHFGHDADFQREAMRLASNTVGWTFVENKVRDAATLDPVIKIVQRGIDNIESMQHYYLHDTMACLLLNAGRPGEAYSIIKQCLEDNPNSEYFEKYEKDKSYLAWAAAN